MRKREPEMHGFLLLQLLGVVIILCFVGILCVPLALIPWHGGGPGWPVRIVLLLVGGGCLWLARWILSRLV